MQSSVRGSRATGNLSHRPLSGTARKTRTGAVTAILAVTALCVPGSAVAAPQQPARPAHPAHAAAHSATPTTAHARQTANAPGDVLSSQDSAFRLIDGVPTPTRAWKISYRSTDASGAPDTVTGTVIVPKDHRKGPRPLITYAVGTVGMGDQCAPSATFPKGGTTEAALINGALLRGWAVAVTDYQGLGTPEEHTYTVGRAAGTAVLDAARAAERLPQAHEAGVTDESPVGVMGYSQGGQASAWAAELQRDYAPELKVKGTASGGVPADLPKVAAYNDGDPDAGLILMSAIGHDAAYPELHLNKYLNAEGRSLTASMRKGCLEENEAAGANKTIDQVTTENPLEQPDWKAKLAADKLGTRTPAQPVYLYHGTSDEIIPYDVGRQLRTDWCGRGATVDFHSVPLSQHVTTAILGSVPAMNWLGKRFADKPTEGNCG